MNGIDAKPDNMIVGREGGPAGHYVAGLPGSRHLPFKNRRHLILKMTFRASNGKTKVLSDRALDRKDAFAMVQRRAKGAGIKTRIGCHTFRATGITIYLTNGGDLEKAQQMAAHESPRTTKLYDRRSDVVSLDEVEKVVF